MSRVICPNSSRVQGLKLNLPNDPYIFINVYFPVDPRNDQTDELIKVLQDVAFILDSCDQNCKIVLMGDLNADFGRGTDFVTLLKSFLHDHNLGTLWNKFDCDFTYAFSKSVNGVQRTYFSTIDHFCVSSDLLPFCIEAMPLHLVDNMSNHAPIFMKFKCEPSRIDFPSDSNTVKPPKPLWKNASNAEIHHYQDDLRHGLSQINLPDCVHCSDVRCQCRAHRDAIDNYACQIMESISSAVNSNIPFSNPSTSSKPPVPGWSDYVKPFRDDAYFWHSIWKSAGRPQNCHLHNVMKSTKNKYHFAIRKAGECNS